MIVSEKEAVALLKAGYVVGIPTDTVYGFAVLEQHKLAVYKLKKRKLAKKLITFVSEQTYFEGINDSLKALMYKSWPGAVTIIFEVNEELTSYRVPKRIEVLNLLKKTGPLLTTSANISGTNACLSASEFEKRFPEVPLLKHNQKISNLRTPSKILVYNRRKTFRIR
ncbi:MAG: L-threonylcarbamoyladenylate synthase [Mycoplasmatales bacterium]